LVVDPDPTDLVANGYDAFYGSWGRSPILAAIWRQHVTEADYPEEFSHISFLGLAQLCFLARGLELEAGQLLVDLACGAGGPGLWAAEHLGARLAGVDASGVAVERASERAAALGLGSRAVFTRGSFENTGLAAGSADGIMTVDALQYVPDKSRAITEVARVLRPGGRFGLVAFELDPERVAATPVWPDPVADYRPLLQQAGFDVLSYAQIPGWQDQVSAAFGEILDQRDALEAELGEAAAGALLLEASITLELQPYCGHVLGIARRLTV
jgi:cyclopropane fatty-acyl-phospholipid synthase-like methyltransferase